ncbi:ABC transporter substrate-binding protein [Microlunatus speluncae]|uniref:ABC transporter substrate-binding protein n=1 Tax=Microlunatus speluncae TaxID=2594267 RepID=UPI001266768F|nr:sugar ABC transporter substrate-binding protein [Microlunatus speluncae]
MTTTTRTRARLAPVVLLAGMTLVLPGCAGFGSLGNQPGVTTVTFASVNNPQMQDLAQLIPEFERAHPDIKINTLMMEENDLRNAATKDVATAGGQYDVMTVGLYEVPIWGQNDWLVDLTDLAGEDPSYDAEDIFEPVLDGVSYDDRYYAMPFYGESSFLMYRKDLFEAAGIEMPERPTWQQVADFAKQLKTPDRAGICLRGKPGWGEMFAPLSTIVNTYGGQWYDENWNAQVNAPGFHRAVEFYLNTLEESGEPDPVSYGFTECLNLVTGGGAAMWYDATSAAGSLESGPNKGNFGYVRAPVDQTDESGWLWSWNLGINASVNADPAKKAAAWEFVKWATSKEYVQLAGERMGWARVPSGTRESTFEIPDYQASGEAFAPLTAEIIQEVDPKQPGIAPQPWIGIQYVTIPEFQDVGNQTSQLVADVIAGRRDLDGALNDAQAIAQRAGDKQKQQ